MSAAPLLDLAQFASVDDALKKIEPDQRYVEVGRSLSLVGQDLPWNLMTMFWLSGLLGLLLLSLLQLHGIAEKGSETGPNPHEYWPRSAPRSALDRVGDRTDGTSGPPALGFVTSP